MKTLKQALKVNLIATYILLGIAVVMFVLQTVVGNILFTMLGAFFLLSVFFNIHDRKRIKRSYCPHCQTQYDYEQAVAWECSNVVTTNRSQKADVEIVCTCLQCGQQTQFTQRFEIAEIDALGRIKEHNIYNIVRKYFKN